jgi:hypothetical protein
MIVKAMGSACLFLEIRWQKGRQADQPFVPNPDLHKVLNFGIKSFSLQLASLHFFFF